MAARAHEGARGRFFKGIWKYKNKREVAKHKQFVKDRRAIRQYTAAQRKNHWSISNRSQADTVVDEHDVSSFEALLLTPSRLCSTRQGSPRDQTVETATSPTASAPVGDKSASKRRSSHRDSVRQTASNDFQEFCQGPLLPIDKGTPGPGDRLVTSHFKGREQRESSGDTASCTVPTVERVLPRNGVKSSLPPTALARFRKELKLADRAKKEEEARRLQHFRLKELRADALRKSQQSRRKKSRLLKQKTAKGQTRMACVVKHLTTKLTAAVRQPSQSLLNIPKAQPIGCQEINAKNITETERNT